MRVATVPCKASMSEISTGNQHAFLRRYGGLRSERKPVSPAGRCTVRTIVIIELEQAQYAQLVGLINQHTSANSGDSMMERQPP